MPLKPGFILRNRYRIESVLGQGGMGAVYMAVDVNLGVTVAVKENLFTTEEFARQFRREATILASLRHPNLPRVTDHFVVEGEGQYLVMDFVQGDDLRQKLEHGGPVREDEALPWFLDVADALAYLHSRMPPVLHRDVKPGNIKITPEGRAILVDFGLAKVVEEDGATTTGAKAMTPGFSPPEQYGSGRTDPRTDIYSLGATLYAALTATIPEDSLERAMGRAQLTPVRKRNANVSTSLARVVEKALAVKPEDRYQSMAELAASLGASPSGSQPTVVRNYQYLEQTRVGGGKTVTVPRRAPGLAPVRRRRRWPVLLIGLVTLGITIAGAVYALGDGESTANEGKTPSAVPSTIPVALPSDTGPAELPTDTAAVPPTETVVASPETLPTQTAPPIGPTPMGGGIGQIAFASTRAGLPQIFLANIDGTGVRQLTTMTDGACQPSWSADGQQLVFTSPCREDQDVYPGSGLWIVQADGGGLTSLPSVPGGDFDPAWSPDGTRIAFASLRDNPNVPHLHLISPLGTDVQRLTEGTARDSQPAWAPSGTQLAFISRRAGIDELWLLPDFGAIARAVVRGTESNSHPEWSHSGQTMVLERKIGGIPRLVALSFEDLNAGARRLCPQGPLASVPMSTPRWSPDDRWLVFETWPDGVNHEIALMTSTCTNYGLLTVDPGQDFDAAWRP